MKASAVAFILAALGSGIVLTFSAAPANAQTEVVIDKKPLQQLSERIAREVNSGKLDLSSPFVVEVKGKLAKNGRLDPSTFKYLKTEGADLKLIGVVKDAIEAINSSGYLEYLNVLEGRTLLLHVEQSGQDFVARIESEFENEHRPKSIAAMLNLFVHTKKTQVSSEANQNELDDLLLLQRAAATSVGKTLTFSLTVTKSDLQAIINHRLAEPKPGQKPTNERP